METLIGRLLRAGVVTSMVLVFSGLVLMFVHHPSYLRSAEALRRLTSPGAAFPKSLAEVAAGLHDGHGQAVVALGLIVLILTPILRVAVSVIAFAFERDRAFVLITSSVLAVLLASFLLGRVG
jgi:uncharacterized membrane protein